jgi:hypothetical protein
MLDINSLRAIAPHLTLLPFQEADRKAAEARVQRQFYSYELAYYRASRNMLCLQVIQAWLSENDFSQTQAWSPTAEIEQLWEFVDGFAVTSGDTRMVFIPTEALNPNELCVPREWVDIPSWAASYYFAIQLDGDRNFINVIGYTTHAALKAAANIDAIDATYRLDLEQNPQGAFVDDITVFWAAQELAIEADCLVAPLPSLFPFQANRLIEQLSQVKPYSPRLELPFEQWAALIANPAWFEQLYQARSHPASTAKADLVQQMRDSINEGVEAVRDFLSVPSLSPALLSAKGEALLTNSRQITIGTDVYEVVVNRTPVEYSEELEILIEARLVSGQTSLDRPIYLTIYYTGASDDDSSADIPIQVADPTVILIGNPGEQFSIALRTGDQSSSIEEFTV